MFLEYRAQPPAQGQGIPLKHVVWQRHRGPSSWPLTSIAHQHLTLGILLNLCLIFLICPIEKVLIAIS